MIQKNIQIGEVNVPIIEDEGLEWFPISHITTKILLRSGKNSLISKQNKEKYEDHLNKYTIKFGESNIQESNCINREGLIKLLKKTQVGRLNVEQRIAQNELYDYLGIDLLPVDEQDTNTYKDEWLDELDDYTKDVVKSELNKNVEWIRGCSKCNNHYPMTSRFYAIHNKADKGFAKVCKVCAGTIEFFTHQNEDENKLRKQSLELYEAMSNDYLPKVFEAYKNGEIKRLPDSYENKESYEKMIRYLFDKGYINKDNLNQSFLMNDCGLKGIYKYYIIDEIYFMLFGNNFYFYAWKYPKFLFKEIKLTYEIANIILNNYIKENNIIIDDIFTYDYEKLFRKCRIQKLTNGNTLETVVKFYNKKHAGYCFKNSAVNYYHKEENLLFDLQYLIEKDMNLDVNKIPLYLTKNVLQKRCRPLYHYIVTKKHGSLYKWIDKLYPNRFIESDFEINAYREEFGSDSEMWIHEILKENFKNVIYNQIHTSRTIEIGGMIPDWLIITDHGVYIVEYFGLFEMRQYGKNTRITEYVDKTHRKIEKYKKLSNYKYLFIYPEDVVDDFKGCRDKIGKMKENIEFTMV